MRRAVALLLYACAAHGEPLARPVQADSIDALVTTRCPALFRSAFPEVAASVDRAVLDERLQCKRVPVSIDLAGTGYDELVVMNGWGGFLDNENQGFGAVAVRTKAGWSTGVFTTYWEDHWSTGEALRVGPPTREGARVVLHWSVAEELPIGVAASAVPERRWRTFHRTLGPGLQLRPTGKGL